MTTRVFPVLIAVLSFANLSVRAEDKGTPLTVRTHNTFVAADLTEPLAGPASRTFEMPATGRAMRLTGALGQPGSAWRLEFRDPNGATVTTLTLSTRDPLEACIDVDLRLPDKTRFRRPYFIKPDLKFYVPESRARRFNMKLAERSAFLERKEVAAKYHLFRSALEHEFTLHLEPLPGGLGLWLDSRFIGSIPESTPVKQGTLALAEGNRLLGAENVPALRQGHFLALELDPYARPGALKINGLPDTIQGGTVQAIEGIPFLPISPGRSIDVGLSRWLEEGIDPPDFCDLDTTRSVFDGCPETIILRVPKENFLCAYLLCAVDPSPEKAPLLTLRLTRFGNHYGDSGGRTDQAIADTVVHLPRDPAGAALPDVQAFLGNVQAREAVPQVHKWSYRDTSMPLFLVKVPLKVGEVSDLLGEDAPAFGRRKDYWNIELTKAVRTTVQFFNLQSYRLKPVGLPSAVHVLGMTLERAPVDVRVAAEEKGNIFYADKEPALTVQATNREDAATDVRVFCRIVDFYGNEQTKEANIALPARGSGSARIALNVNRLGYFDAVVSAVLPDGREVWRQPTSFALLPPDTRTAGNESPFGVWWFYRSHGCSDRLNWMGPILQKAGIRHCCPGPLTSEQMAPYQLSYSMAPSVRRRGDQVKELLHKNPNIRLGMIFHERSIPDTQAIFPELLGRPKPALSERGQQVFTQYWAHAEEVATWYRENHPDMLISFGNSPPGISAWFMREGWPKKWVDCFGMEGVGAWNMTESPPRRGAMQEVWELSEMRKFYGYEDVPVSSGYEYIGRGTQPGALTERQAADYHTRDAIHCLAYGYPSINIGAADDCADSYYSTIYGSSGFVRRNPLLTPKPGYVMYATMTRLLDSAAYERYLDTGSRSLYVLEFAKDTGFVYPIWTLRGTRELTLTVADRSVTATDSMGNAEKITPKKSDVRLTATTTPLYLTTTTPLQRVTPGPAHHTETPSAGAVVINDLSDPDGWTVDGSPDTYLETYADDIPYTRGQFDIRKVADDERGPSVELNLQPAPDIPGLVGRYVSLRFKDPVTLEGEATRIGTWVRGNSCWGRIFWEFLDANGERYFSASDETSGWDVSDWKNRSAINFDGWCYISLSVPKRYPGGFHGPEDRDWSYHGGDRDGVVQHPITLTRVVVAMRDQQVYVTDMVTAQSRTLRLAGLTAELK